MDISIEAFNNAEIFVKKGRLCETNEGLIIVSCYDIEHNIESEFLLTRESAIKLMVHIQSILNTM